MNKKPFNWGLWAAIASILSCIGNYMLVFENYWNGHGSWPF